MPNSNPNWITEQNIAVKGWANLVTSKLKSSALRFRKGKTGMVIRGVGSKNQHAEDKLVNSIGRKIYMASGLAEGIGFKIERHGIFVHKGVGNGYIMQNGIVIRGARKPKPGKIYSGPINRRPVNWFNTQIDAYAPDLANKIAAINADAVINELNVRIK